PPARPGHGATLRMERELLQYGRQEGLTITEELLPPEKPNHLHVRVSSLPYREHESLQTDEWGQVRYREDRRLATKYYLWWSSELPWIGWFEVPGDGHTDTGLATQTFGGRDYVFAKGSGGQTLYVNSTGQTDGGGWTGWLTVPGELATDTGVAVTTLGG